MNTLLRNTVTVFLIIFNLPFSFARNGSFQTKNSVILSEISHPYTLCYNNNDSLIKFAYLADLHISDVASNVEDLKMSIADINSMQDLDFAIFAGDITEFGSDREILLAESIIEKLKIPWFIISGNHDSKWSESGCNTFARVFGYEHFSFEIEGIQFIGCNSGPNMRMAPALVPRESIVWLDSVTRALPPGKPVIFVNHYPLDEQMLNYRQVLRLLSRTNIQVALCGHGHNNKVLSYPLDFINGTTKDVQAIRGVMGRSNLRAGKSGAGYNIITVDLNNGSLSFCERVNGATLEPWHKLNTVDQGHPEKIKEPYVFVAREHFNDSAISLKDSANRRKVEERKLPVALWQIQDNSDIGSGAVYYRGVVFYANTAGEVKAIDATSGKRLWRFPTKGKIFSTPALSCGYLVVGSSDNSIYCLAAASGKLLWKVEAEKSVLASPAIYKGYVYIGASDGTFRAIDLPTGKLRWKYEGIKGFIEAKAWVDDEGVYIGDWASTLYALDTDSGSLLWTWSNGKSRAYSPAAVWPVKADGKVFVVTPERKTYAIDARTGKKLWEANGGRESIGLSLHQDAIYVKTMQDTVIAFSTAHQALTAPLVLWRSCAGYGYEIAPSPITTADGFLFVPTDKGNIFALRESDGSVAWTYRFSTALINYIQPVGLRRLLISSMDGKVGIIKY
jgi:outer membrane protein assembly factor BamB